MTCLRCKHHEAKRFGFYGRKRIQRYRCPGCKATFSEPRQKPLGTHYIEVSKATEIITLLLEGMSVRAVSRITGTHQGTILSLLLTVGKKCRSLAQLIKLYGMPDTEGPDWYKPSQVIATVPTPVSGNPIPSRISTSHIERANLSVRTHLRRLTRLALGFSKTLEHLKAAVALYMAFFNFCRVHQTLRVTPAMQAGIADHVWDIRELLTWGGD